MIFSRGLALRLEQKEERLREEGRAEVRDEIDEAVKAAYEAGVRDTLAKMRENGPDDTSE